ncbi:putative cysteine-rich receptor-like protein kinase 43 [Cynara cardunculus var. scolymus]|uniref:Gnk2-homologous domain-containing protein n=1 Tax=Cynara cardunculus var. scolymus TaxID=59895 RepID=A0A103Y3T3_CYNCS|nr:putative cysteine-rich receptor-like protein kinase 43 [Cynara cardunculus var. scolymus]KVI01990.1 Gnk2-homologous domain-containing protein [Cynara cardunculus var. scolymus]
MTKWQTMVVAFLFKLFLANSVTSQPQTKILINSCGQINASNPLNFFHNLNETFGNVRRQLSNNKTYFVTAEQTRNSEPVYVLCQCRKYMSTRDCVACFDFAVRSIRSCAPAKGARRVLDGCYLRYESNSFYDETTNDGNVGLCGNRTSSRQGVFETAVDGLLSDLSIATPRISGFYAAATAPVVGTNTTKVYAIAQCVERVTRNGCKDCLHVAYANIKICPTVVTDGRAIDSGCFMRGYTAPEYAIHGQLSEKVDTYSFGIVVLEIVSGKRCTDVRNESAGEQYLLEHAWNLYETRMHLKLVDETLDPSKYREDDIKKVIEIALMCTQSPVSVRPTMSEVVMLLSDRSRVQNPPSRQNVNLTNIRTQTDNSTSTTLSMSNNDATITELTGR